MYFFCGYSHQTANDDGNGQTNSVIRFESFLIPKNAQIRTGFTYMMQLLLDNGKEIWAVSEFMFINTSVCNN